MDAENSNQPAPEFIESILRSLNYWQQQTKNLQPEQVKKLDKQRRNLNTAVQFGLSQPVTWEATATVLLQAFNFAEWRGYWGEWIPILQQALASAPEKETVIYGRLQNELGQLYRLSHKFPEALAQHQHALTLAEKLAELELKAISYQNLCEAYLRSNQFPEAKEYGLLALQAVQMLSDHKLLQASILNSLGEVSRFGGNLATAEDYLRQAVTLRRELAEPVYLARSLNDLGNILGGQNKYEAAQRAFEEAEVILRSTTDVIHKAKVRLNLGVLFYHQKRWAEAEDSFRQIDLLALRAYNDLALVGGIYNNLGNVYLKQGRYLEAADSLTQAIQIWRSIENELELANSLGTLAEVRTKTGQIEVARPLFQDSLTLLARFPENAWGQKLLRNFKVALARLPD